MIKALLILFIAYRWMLYPGGPLLCDGVIPNKVQAETPHFFVPTDDSCKKDCQDDDNQYTGGSFISKKESTSSVGSMQTTSTSSISGNSVLDAEAICCMSHVHSDPRICHFLNDCKYDSSREGERLRFGKQVNPLVKMAEYRVSADSSTIL